MKELEDITWFPSVLRNFQTEFIGFVVTAFRVYQPFIRHLRSLELPPQPMTDLCSGSGQPAISIFRKTNCFTHLTLTDKYPNPLSTGDDLIKYDPQQSDVLDMEFKPGRYYTMFNAFHHFSDQDKVKILKKIHASGSQAFFVEILEPRPDCLLKVILLTTLGTLLFTPFIRPFSLPRLFFTYLMPINILTITFDGVVSVFKARSVQQYQKIFAPFGKAIHINRLKGSWAPQIVIHLQSAK